VCSLKSAPADAVFAAVAVVDVPVVSVFAAVIDVLEERQPTHTDSYLAVVATARSSTSELNKDECVRQWEHTSACLSLFFPASLQHSSILAYMATQGYCAQLTLPQHNLLGVCKPHVFPN
jgi:hypothetical protein